MATPSILRALAPAFNVTFNAATAYSVNWFVGDGQGLKVSLIVALDTLFRIVITQFLTVFKIPYIPTGTTGHLFFSLITLVTLPLSAKTSDRLVGIDQRCNPRTFYMMLFGYIALSWKVNSMIKDVVHLCYSSLKQA